MSLGAAIRVTATSGVSPGPAPGPADPAGSPAGQGRPAPGRNNTWPFYIVTWVLATILAMVVTTLLAVGGLWGGWLPADLARRMTGADHPATFLLANGAVFAAFLGSFAVVIRMVHRRGFGDIVGRWRWPLFGAGAAAWTLALALLTFVDLALAPSGFSVTASPQTATLAAAALAGLSVQTFAEEFVFRGYLTQGLLAATRRPWAAAALSGLIFGAVHIPNGWPQAANATVFGVVLALIAIRTGGIAFGFGLHLVNNLFGAVAVVSSQDVFRGAPALVTQHTPQLMWWDTAAAAVALVALAAAVLRRVPALVPDLQDARSLPPGFHSATGGARKRGGQGRGT
ncbi:type II CAAX endopeptidase family protein [Phenylobacterium sp.]|uniref:CPBP family intramembrane glutamic endopeptidase n=1 Tax=Phenylobacterium sp. TaxID=1871053 RepID=UPI002F3EFAEB